LDEAIEEMDALTLKRFRQNACFDPVATCVLHFDKLVRRKSSDKLSALENQKRKKEHVI
jgi:hypothetical protein